MSLESTSTLKSKISFGLGEHAPKYWTALRQFLTAKISRTEFEDEVRQYLDTIALVQLHNNLVISLFDPSTHKVAALTPPPDAAASSRARKRRRLLPYQGEGEDDVTELRSERLKQWVVGVGKRERDRIRGLGNAALSTERQPRLGIDEMANERAIALPTERRDPAGSRPSVQLASSARGFTLGHVTDRINLICAQHDLAQPPSRTVASLLALAFEAKLKQLIIEALSMTTSSHAISSIKPSAPHSSGNLLSTSAFDTLFTVAPASLPNGSAAATRLTSGEIDNRDHDNPLLSEESRDPDNPQWQLLALLRERSGMENLETPWK
ncbi:hypothetical protein PENSPDRAFT_755922 [Peniophora sp. CONT]|nr:hypothetical protein PENSPDRAFT_755922 [Peniophora sp. CONT]